MKSRNLSIYDYFEVLQKEYICSLLRSRIFTKNHSQYWVTVMTSKKEKIENIATKNNLTSIFTDTREYDRVYALIVPGWGTPQFLYVSEVQREKLQKWDILLYFGKQTQVKVLLENGEVELGTIIENSKCFLEYPTVTIKFKGREKTIVTPIHRVARVF